MNLAKALVSEFLGTAILLATVVGSGILGEKLAFGHTAIVVLVVAIATGCVLTGTIFAFSGLSSHFNPVVTLINAFQKNLKWKHVLPFIVFQVLGAIAGVILANVMFELAPISISDSARTGYGQWVGEIVATFCLIGIIMGCGKFRPDAVPPVVGAYVTGAIWFTSSTCFANPAVTIARIFSNTITGIRPVDVPAFVAFELVGGVAAYLLFSWLLTDEKPSGKNVEQTRKNLEKEFANVRNPGSNVYL